MKLTAFNCSPKLGDSNTQLFLEIMTQGMVSEGGQAPTIHKLNKLNSMDDAVKLFEEANAVIIAMPLYSYAMPGGTMRFFEALEPLTGKCQGKKLGFIIQYGFVEAIHGRPLERYLIKLSEMLGCDYIGTVIKGGCDGLSRLPKNATKGIRSGAYDIGKTLAKNGRFDKDQLNAYAAPEVAEKKAAWKTKLFILFVNKFYWGKSLKKNGVSKKDSFAKPYEYKERA